MPESTAMNTTEPQARRRPSLRSRIGDVLIQAILGVVILGFAAAFIYGAFFAKEDDVDKAKHQRMPAVGDCLNSNDQARLITDCSSSDAAVRVLATFNGGQSSQCAGTPGATDALIYKESTKIGGADGVDISDPEYTTLCVGPAH
jgi:hypothetical protein